MNTDKLTASEAIYGFAAWLTTRPERTIFGSIDDCAHIAQLCAAYIKNNELAPPREFWYSKNLENPNYKYD